MSEETKYWGDELIERYPKIFNENFYFECNQGWKEILDNACGLIQNHCDNLEARNNNQANQVKAVQIKEKFGGLRYYIDGGDETIYGMIRLAESLSFTICEECGESGKLRSGGWMKTLCDKHEAERQARYAERKQLELNFYGDEK